MAGAVEVLGRLAGRVGTLAILTGRPAAFASQRSGIADLAAHRDLTSGSVLVLGHYGAERYDAADGRVHATPPPPEVDAARRRVRDLLAPGGPLEGCALEDKGRSVAVHARRAPDPAAAFTVMSAILPRVADELGLHAEPGKLVVELRPSGVDKGSALTALVAERGARAVVYAGDDLGDVPAFEAVRALRGRGLAGHTLASLSAEEKTLEALADEVVDGPSGVVAFLTALADALPA